jgi:hypothetical protein
MVNSRPTCVDQRLGTTGVFRCWDFGIYSEARGWMSRLRIQMDEVGHKCTDYGVYTITYYGYCSRRVVMDMFMAGDGVEEALLGIVNLRAADLVGIKEEKTRLIAQC